MTLIMYDYSRAWCKTIATTLLYITSYNSFATVPRFIITIYVVQLSVDLYNVHVWIQLTVSSTIIEVTVRCAHTTT